MELFKITCVTCSARLSVRDVGVIGHILACPRCGSMVEVTAPATAAPGAAPSQATPTSVTPAPPITASAAPLAESTVFEVADLGEPVEAAAPAAGAEVAPPAEAMTGAAGFKLAAIVLAGALAGSAAVGGMLTLFSREAPHEATAPAAEIADRAIENNSDDAEEEGAPTEAPIEPTEVAADEPPDSAELAAADAAADDVAVSPSTPPAVPQPPADAEPAASAIAEAPREPPAEAPKERLRIDPLEVDPEGLDMATLFRPRSEQPASPSQINEPPAAAPSVAEAESAAEPAEDNAPPRAEPAVRRDAALTAGPANMAALLARRVPAVRAKEMPLCRFLDLAGQLSGIPVSVDPTVLRLASVSAGAPVSVDAKDATIEELLAAAVKPLRLAPVVEDSQLVLRRAAADRRRSTTCPVGDLTSGGPTAEELAGWIQSLVVPESWAAAGGDGQCKVVGQSLELDQREDVTYEAFILLERYRLARGLPTRTKYPAALLAPGAAIAEQMGGATTFTFSDYTPLREIFRWWQEELEAAVLVDWPALAGDRLWPQTQVATSVINQPWPAALDAVLAPLGLGWRPAGAKAIEITTLAKVRGEAQLELYRLAPGSTASAEELAKLVADLAAADAAGMGATAATAVKYDAANRVLVVRAPASVQRRLDARLVEQALLAAK